MKKNILSAILIMVSPIYVKSQTDTTKKNTSYITFFDQGISSEYYFNKELKGNFVINFTTGTIFFPSSIKGEKDTKTNVDISNKKHAFGLALEYFMNGKDRIGAEFQFHKLEKAISTKGNLNSIKISGGSGFIFTANTYYKWAIGKGIYGKKYRQNLDDKIQSISNDILYKYDHTKIRNLKAIRKIEPKPYLILGAGISNTTLVKVKGNPSDIKQTYYKQNSLTVEPGIGVLCRLSKRLISDLSIKYFWNTDYSPSIGGLDSYSGFMIQLNVGFMFAQINR